MWKLKELPQVHKHQENINQEKTAMAVLIANKTDFKQQQNISGCMEDHIERRKAEVYKYNMEFTHLSQKPIK